MFYPSLLSPPFVSLHYDQVQLCCSPVPLPSHFPSAFTSFWLVVNKSQNFKVVENRWVSTSGASSILSQVLIVDASPLPRTVLLKRLSEPIFTQVFILINFWMRGGVDLLTAHWAGDDIILLPNACFAYKLSFVIHHNLYPLSKLQTEMLQTSLPPPIFFMLFFPSFISLLFFISLFILPTSSSFHFWELTNSETGALTATMWFG